MTDEEFEAKLKKWQARQSEPPRSRRPRSMFGRLPPGTDMQKWHEGRKAADDKLRAGMARAGGR